MISRYEGRLELTWTNKAQRLLADEDGNYTWVPPSDYRVAEVRLLHDVETIGDCEADRNRARDNLVIRGEALNALRSLSALPEFAREFLGKVKLAYLDPPFNTQQSFLHYDDALEHSVWLTMMRDRLLQVKTLLAPDGSIWVHCDDSEQHRLRCVLDAVFGPNSFVATIIWQKRYSRDNRPAIGPVHDFILVYAPAGQDWRQFRNRSGSVRMVGGQEPFCVRALLRRRAPRRRLGLVHVQGSGGHLVHGDRAVAGQRRRVDRRAFARDGRPLRGHAPLQGGPVVQAAERRNPHDHHHRARTEGLEGDGRAGRGRRVRGGEEGLRDAPAGSRVADREGCGGLRSQLRRERSRRRERLVTFRGTGVDWYTVRGPDQGRAQLFVDGRPVKAVGNFAKKATFAVKRSIGGLADGMHRLRIVVLGQSRPPATGSLVSVDRFVVRG